jgi:penicillin-binding protein 1A
MTQRQRRRHRRRGHKRNIVLGVATALLATVAAVVLAVGGWVLDTAAKAPDLDTLKPIAKGQTSVVYAGDGSRLGFIRSDEARTPVAPKRIPIDLQYATIAIEDERFFQHDGIDVEGGFRALVENIEAGEVVQGASTITMQLMRNLYITDPQRDAERKIIEAQLALDYEDDYEEKYGDRGAKRRILGQYLNNASYGTVLGRTAIGVQAASKIYFSRPVWELTLEQSALLAGLPQAPSQYNPLTNPRAALERRNEVLEKMAELGYISSDRARRAVQAGLQLNPTDEYSRIREPYFFDYVENELIERYGVNQVRRGGLKVHTTIDPELQEVGREAIASVLPYSTDPSSAIVAIDPRNGEIKAMVSSSSYEENKYNLAAQGRRQPGSTFKTFVLTAAVKQGIDPYSTYYNSQPLSLDLPEYGHWEVATYSNSYSGSSSVASATLASDNTVYAQLDLDVGPEEVAETAKAMGIETELDGIPAEGLGGLRLGVSPLEMASAYATLASGGVHRPPVSIEKVEFPSGRVDRPDAEEERRVLPEAVAYEVTQILHDNMTSGTGTGAYTGCYGQAGKTGTTDNYTDAWFVGYQPNVSAAVWVGYPEDNKTYMTSVHGITVAGGTFPADIWNNFMYGGGFPCEDFDVPEEPIEWSQFFGSYTSSSSGSYSTDGSYTPAPSAPTDDGSGDGDAGGQSYDPDLYAPGAGQQPAPAPPSPPPAPAPPSPPGGGVGNGGPTGGASPG